MVTAQIALSMGLLMGFLALLTDGGILLVERRHAQATADAAALAAASDFYANWNTNKGADPSGTANSSALGVASANGYTNDGTTSKVTVNVSPAKYSGGPNVGTKLPPGYAEATVTWYQPRGFSGVFGSGAIPVSARAVARGLLGASGADLLLLSPTGTALSSSGNGSLNVSGGTVAVNSTSSSAVSASGNGSLTAQSFSISGNYNTSGNATLTTTPTKNNIQTGVSPAANPLSYLPTPSVPAQLRSSSQLQISGNTSTTLQPGLYTGGISISGNGSVTLQPGIYYIQGGGLSVSGNGNISGTGVMIYNDGGGAINISGNGNVNLTPMTTGSYPGIFLFQAPTSTMGISISGNGNFNISGTLYAADAGVQLSGNGDTLGTQIIASTLSMSGNGSVIVNGGGPQAEDRLFGLVE
jgi:hypothetical protein